MWFFNIFFLHFRLALMSAPFFAGCIGIQTNSGICKKKGLVQMQTWKEKKGNREKEVKERKSQEKMVVFKSETCRVAHARKVFMLNDWKSITAFDIDIRAKI